MPFVARSGAFVRPPFGSSSRFDSPSTRGCGGLRARYRDLQGQENRRGGSQTMRPTPLILAAAAGVLLASGPAIAESIAVPYNDLDLSTAQGQKQLEQRIDKAAKQVCGVNAAVTGTRLPPPDAYRCVKQAKQQIERKLAALLDRQKAGGQSAHSPAGAHTVP
jgi:UrcA family protein